MNASQAGTTTWLAALARATVRWVTSFDPFGPYSREPVDAQV